MNTILFPTDFSKNADNALQYAVKIASLTQSKLVLFHSYHVPVTTPDVVYADYQVYNEELENSFKEKLQQKIEEIHKNNPGLTCDISVNYGFALDSIINYSESNKVDLIIMGTRGASGLKEVVFGSITASVIEKASCPVLAVPEKAPFKGINKIVFATDLENAEDDTRTKIIEFAKSFDAHLEVLYIQTELEIDEEKDKIFEHINENVDYPKTSFHIEVFQDIEEGIEKFVKRHNPDVLAMITHKRGAIEKLFHRSITKKMAYHSQLPLLAFHD